MTNTPPEWAGVHSDVVKEIVRQAEIHITQQGAVAQSLEQRAISLSTMTNAAAAAVLAFLASAWVNDKAEISIVIGGIATAATWFAAAVMALRSATPQEFYLPGRSPSSWYQACSFPFHDCLGVIAEQMDSWILKNEMRNSYAVRWLKRSLRAATLAPLVGVAAWLSFNWGSNLFFDLRGYFCLHP